VPEDGPLSQIVRRRTWRRLVVAQLLGPGADEDERVRVEAGADGEPLEGDRSAGLRAAHQSEAKNVLCEPRRTYFLSGLPRQLQVCAYKAPKLRISRKQSCRS